MELNGYFARFIHHSLQNSYGYFVIFYNNPASAVESENAAVCTVLFLKLTPKCPPVHMSYFIISSSQRLVNLCSED